LSSLKLIKGPRGKRMPRKLKILIMGASYGSLLGTKFSLAGHDTHLICLPVEADLMNTVGAIVRMPVKGREGLVEVNSKNLSGKLTAGGPDGVDPAKFDLVALAMQEPQYRQPGVRDLLDRVAKAKVPAMSIMNMPPLTYLKRIPGLNADLCRDCYTDPTVWDSFDPRYMTLCSPDPQAFRPPEEKVNVLQVRLPTNFKSARFESDEHTAVLRQLEADIEASRFEVDGKPVELPVKLRCMTASSSRWPNGPCCCPGITAASRRTACARSGRRYTPISMRRVRSTTGS
jgi:hypothetical protein